MTKLSTDFFVIKRTTWSALPVALSEAATLAFPNCKSPISISDDKWEKLLVAYKTWYHIFYSDGLPLFLSSKYFSRERLPEMLQHYLNDIALSIANE